MSSEAPLFIPVKRCELLRNESNIWARLTFGRTDKDVRSSLTDVRARPYFPRILKQKQSPNADEIWFETKPTVGTRRGMILRFCVCRLTSRPSTWQLF